MLQCGKSVQGAGARHVPVRTNPSATETTRLAMARAAVVSEFLGPVVMTSSREIVGSLIGAACRRPAATSLATESKPAMV